ncbi:MAG: hypothetical protein P1V97_05910 [Planctomycetota bacterium]|nr:hypothetical protein [Planctomycetota bacterium]
MRESATAPNTLFQLADWIESIWPHQTRPVFLVHLKRPIPSERQARLDSHDALLRRYLKAIEACLSASPPSFACPAEIGSLKPQSRSLFSASDFLASLAFQLYPEEVKEARQLAVALSRLSEESPRLLSRKSLPLGKGFEDLFQERLERRYQWLPDEQAFLDSLEEQGMTFLEEPAQAYEAFEREFGCISEAMKLWLESERRVGLLRFVRRDKTDGKGHIRWYLRADSTWKYVLERLGVEGHWATRIKTDSQAAARLLTAYERCVGYESTENWRLLETRLESLGGTLQDVKNKLREDPEAFHCRDDKPTAEIRMRSEALKDERNWRFDLRKQGDRWTILSGGDATPIASLSLEASSNEVLDFFAVLDALSDLALVGLGDRKMSTSVERALALFLDVLSKKARAKTRVRMVYVPSEIPHQLGGVPEVGAQFLKDRLEKGEREVLLMKLYRRDFQRRMPELLGADVIGIGVYIHNRDDVAELCQLLREAGFSGRIVLGGPETRSIDDVQEDVAGWDAIIRGEADDVLGQVLDVFKLFDNGDRTEALDLLRTLEGVALRQGDQLFLCHTASRNRSDEVLCPLPFDWGRSHPGRVKMNFSRGCPYLCTFCPNHQGRQFRAGETDELWRFSALAVADNLALPPALEQKVARSISAALGDEVDMRLRSALHLMEQAWDRYDWRSLLSGCFADVIDPRLEGKTGSDLFIDLLGLDPTVIDPGPQLHGSRELRALWLYFKTMLLASRQLWRRNPTESPLLEAFESIARPRFTIETSEDNTLVNRRVITEYLAKRLRYDLAGDFLFNPGQNTIRDLMNSRGQADEDFIALLVDQNPFAVAFGADGTSNAVLRQNRKPGYGVEALVAVNKALGRFEVEVANNYILLTPETSFLEAMESFALWLVLPVPWRDYGNSMNLRVIKEDTTLTNDEGLIFDPDDEGWDGPFRDPQLKAFIEKWKLSSLLNRSKFLASLRRIFLEDEEAAVALELLVERWQENPEKDGEMKALAGLIAWGRRDGQSVGEALFDLRSRVYSEALIDRQCKASLSDLLESTFKGLSSGAKTSV